MGAGRLDAGDMRGRLDQVEAGVRHQPRSAASRFSWYNASSASRGVSASGSSRSIGPASARLQVQYSPDAAGSTQSFTWIEGQIGWDFTPRLNGAAAVGRRDQTGGPDYTGWNAGVTYALTDALELDLRYYDTDANSEGEQYEEALVASVNYAF